MNICLILQQQQPEDDEMLVPHTDFPQGPQPMEGSFAIMMEIFSICLFTEKVREKCLNCNVNCFWA